MGVNKFPTEVLPEEFQAIIGNRKDVNSWDVNAHAVSLLSASASTIGSTVKINDGNDRSEKPILWVCIVGESGTGKSPIIDNSFKYLADKDNEEMQFYLERFNEWETSGREGKIPTEKNHIISDYTPEVLIPAHQNNERGLTVKVDELAGWVKSFDQYKSGSGGQREATLSLFNGRQLKANRASKKVLWVKESCVNVIGGIQPSKLTLINSKESQGDGFMQRFLLVRMKPTLQPKTRQKINTDLLANSYKVFEGVFNYPEKIFTLTEEADELYMKWFNEWHEKTYQDELQRTIHSKLDYYALRISIVLEVLNQVSTGSHRETVGSDTMQKAIKVVEFFRAEALATFKETYSPLAKFGKEVIELYNELNGESLGYGELKNHFRTVWISDRTLRKHLSNTELFTQVKHGIYKRAYVE